MSATDSVTPQTVSIQVGEAIHQIDVEDLYYHSTHEDTLLGINQEVLAAVESGSSGWINNAPVEITWPYTLMRVDHPYSPWIWRSMEGSNSHFLSGIRFFHGRDHYQRAIGATVAHLRYLQAFLTQIDKPVFSDSGTVAIPLIKYRHVVFSPYRHYIHGEGKLSITFSEHIGQNGWLNQVIWTRYFRNLLDQEFPQYSTLTNLANVTITKSQCQAIRNYIAVKIVGLRHLVADAQYGSSRENFKPDPNTGLASEDFIDASFSVKHKPRQEYNRILSICSL